MVSKEVKELRKLKDFALTGAITTEAVSILGRPSDTAFVTGKIPGFVGIGVAGKASDIGFDLVTSKKKKKRRK